MKYIKVRGDLSTNVEDSKSFTMQRIDYILTKKRNFNEIFTMFINTERTGKVYETVWK